MKRSVLQVPLAAELQQSARHAAVKQGFSSLQDAVRLFLRQLASGKTIVRLESADEERLSPRAEKRYAKMLKEIQRGKGVTKTENVDELLKLLYA